MDWVSESLTKDRMIEALQNQNQVQERVTELKSQEENNAEMPELSVADIQKIADAAYLQMLQSRFDEAEKITSALASLIPGNWYFHSMLGVIHLQAFAAGAQNEKYSLDVAENALNRAIELYPYDIATYVNRAEVLLYKGNLTGALDNLKQVKALDPECRNPYTARAQQFAFELVQALERVQVEQAMEAEAAAQWRHAS